MTDDAVPHASLITFHTPHKNNGFDHAFLPRSSTTSTRTYFSPRRRGYSARVRRVPFSGRRRRPRERWALKVMATAGGGSAATRRAGGASGAGSPGVGSKRRGRSSG